MEHEKQKKEAQCEKQQKQAAAAKRKKRQVISASTVTFMELRRILQEMRPYTLQVLRTPYYRNCKAARNMRRDMRQMRDLCKQVRLETVLLGKKSKAEGIRRRQRRPAKKPAPPTADDDNVESPVGAGALCGAGAEGEEKKKAKPEVVDEESQDGPSFVSPPADTPTSGLGSTPALPRQVKAESLGSTPAQQLAKVES